MNLLRVVKRMLHGSDQAVQTAIDRLNEVIASLDNQSQLINQRLTEAILGLDNQSQLINQRMSENVQGVWTTIPKSSSTDSRN